MRGKKYIIQDKFVFLLGQYILQFKKTKPQYFHQCHFIIFALKKLNLNHIALNIGRENISFILVKVALFAKFKILQRFLVFCAFVLLMDWVLFEIFRNVRLFFQLLCSHIDPLSLMHTHFYDFTCNQSCISSILIFLNYWKGDLFLYLLNIRTFVSSPIYNPVGVILKLGKENIMLKEGAIG